MAESGEQSVGEAPVQPPSKAKDAVYAMLGSQVRTTLSDGRVVQGTLQCMDRLTNFILADAVETGTAPAEPTAGSGGRVNDVQDGDEGSVGNDADNADSSSTSSSAGQQPGAQQRHLGVVMIPGKHLVRVERLGVTYGQSRDRRDLVRERVLYLFVPEFLGIVCHFIIFKK